MRIRSAHFRAIPFLIALAIFASGPDFVRAAEGQAQGRSVPFFSQGQAVYNPQDHAKSQQQAIQDFLGQAITQAAGRFMSPSQMGSQFSDLQKKIFPHAQNTWTRTVFSETQVGGLYKVLDSHGGMDALRKDLEESGFPVAEAAPMTPPPMLPDPARPPPTVTTAARTAVTGEVPGRAHLRGLALTKKEILWAVPEKWEQEWIIPGASGTPLRFLPKHHPRA